MKFITNKLLSSFDVPFNGALFHFSEVVHMIIRGEMSINGSQLAKMKKRVFLKCPCHKIYRDEAVGQKSCKYT